MNDQDELSDRYELLSSEDVDENVTRLEKIWNVHAFEEEEPMSFGESVTVLIALGVLIYLIYALLLPERF